MEYIRAALKRALQKRSPPSLTPTDLWTALKDSWCPLPPALLQTVIESMQRRGVAAILLDYVLRETPAHMSERGETDSRSIGSSDKFRDTAVRRNVVNHQTRRMMAQRRQLNMFTKGRIVGMLESSRS
ncbi:hypothetical protein TNCV_1480601 [Trichonephila clavipes]|nr:hypothetical protein TNCV_1480601 [Trichonephila clavipes]